MVEAELAAERKLRINLEHKAADLNKEVDRLEQVKTKLEGNLKEANAELKANKRKVADLEESDVHKNDAETDCQIFCRWIINKYGGIDAGFRILDDDCNGEVTLGEFIDGLKTMGWIKIIGRRLYKLFDYDNVNRITLARMQEIYHKFVEGRGDTPEDEEDIRAEKAMDAAMAAMADKKKGELEEAQMQLRQKELKIKELQDEIATLRKKVHRNMMFSATASRDSQKVQGLERKVDTMKAAMEDLKKERDELTSKVTAAMWQCRQARIQQVKHERAAEDQKEEAAKVNRKFELFKTTLKRAGPSATHDLAGLVHNVMSAPSDKTDAIVNPMGRTAPPGGCIGDDEGGGAEDQPPTSAGDGFATCPSCKTRFRIGGGAGGRRASLSKELAEGSGDAFFGTMRRLSKALTSGNFNELPLSDLEGLQQMSEVADSMRQDSKPKRETAEEVVARMNDEELLWGDAEGGAPAHSSMPYRLRMEARCEGRSMKRTEMLFADANDRMMGSTMGSHGSIQSPSGETSPMWLMNSETATLLQQAHRNQELWSHSMGSQGGLARTGTEIIGYDTEGNPIFKPDHSLRIIGRSIRDAHKYDSNSGAEDEEMGHSRSRSGSPERPVSRGPVSVVGKRTPSPPSTRPSAMPDLSVTEPGGEVTPLSTPLGKRSVSPHRNIGVHSEGYETYAEARNRVRTPSPDGGSASKRKTSPVGRPSPSMERAAAQQRAYMQERAKSSATSTPSTDPPLFVVGSGDGPKTQKGVVPRAQSAGDEGPPPRSGGPQFEGATMEGGIEGTQLAGRRQPEAKDKDSSFRRVLLIHETDHLQGGQQLPQHLSLGSTKITGAWRSAHPFAHEDHQESAGVKTLGGGLPQASPVGKLHGPTNRIRRSPTQDQRSKLPLLSSKGESRGLDRGSTPSTADTVSMRPSSSMPDLNRSPQKSLNEAAMVIKSPESPDADLEKTRGVGRKRGSEYVPFKGIPPSDERRLT
eukprot:gnl/TRDRNA2_/TRDRNA2_93614_c0_seq1.p1 gnl/TRDRNA2_/TRDRNA2_93614_c0~~gnl/TRDRNA2_/TRDRNA2_93614_c0_seq1.p1  ORF type:complete len:997 (+),score=203.30 gnl/TRDRNA2_/TRDRNA2_93614_c0_seq1:61-2991(+)